MKIIIFILLSLLNLSCFGFTLSSSQEYAFSHSEVDIYIAGNSCENANFTLSQLVSMVKNASNDFWNKVSTSSLVLKVKGIREDIDISGDSFTTALNKAPTNNSILIGCNALEENGFDQEATLGAATLGCTGGTCKGIVMLNNNDESFLALKSVGELEAIIAHEIGHAFGLGHSEFKHNLMYYSIGGKTQQWLGQDDVNGVTYLYPNESEFGALGISLLGNCGSLNLDGDNNHAFIYQTLAAFILSLFLLGLYQKKTIIKP